MKVERDAKVKNILSGLDNLFGLEGSVYRGASIWKTMMDQMLNWIGVINRSR